jgi:hypothetical protein
MKPLIHRPTKREVERLRLILSAYQDGTGMLQLKGGTTLPGWRDFERSVALAFKGEAQESKAIFDVLLPVRPPDVMCGVSCKMRSELKRIDRDGRVTIELSNSAGKFWDYLDDQGIHQRNYKKRPREVGIALIELVESWHRQVSLAQRGNVELSRSFYLALSWSRDGWYQLHQFPLALPDPKRLNWYFPATSGGSSRHLNGDDSLGTIFEWYGESGGQLKYYPLAKHAVWASERFRLEPLGNVEHGIVAKVAAYFPELWSKVE